jgi:ribosomal protein L6P/L9E
VVVPRRDAHSSPAKHSLVPHRIVLARRGPIGVNHRARRTIHEVRLTFGYARGEEEEIKTKYALSPPCDGGTFLSRRTRLTERRWTTIELGMFVTDPAQKAQRMMWGTTRTLIANAITGQTTGFTLPVYLLGVGFRAALEPDPRRLPMSHQDVIAAGGPDVPRTRLAMKLGYSHTVYVVVPEGIKVTLPSPTKIVVFGTDKAKVGQFAADIRTKRKPEPYKGKVGYFFPRAAASDHY